MFELPPAVAFNCSEARPIVHNQVVRGERSLRSKLTFNDIGGAVGFFLGRPKKFRRKTVGIHDVIANGQAVHLTSL